MKFFFISEGGDGVGLALRIQQEGNEVCCWIKDDDASHRGDGLVPKSGDFDAPFDIDRDTIIVADCTGNGQICDALRKSGYPVIGGCALADRLEMDRSFAREVMIDAGIKVPPSQSFSDWDTAAEFVQNNDDEIRLVFKPSGGMSGVLPSYVSADNEDMLQMLEYYRIKTHGDANFELQEFKEGIAVSTEGWFDGDKFLSPFNHTIERKQLMNNDLGPSGGCTGNVVWVNDVVVSELMALTQLLHTHGYVGPIDLNAVINEEGLWGLEFTPRFGYDATPTALFELVDGGVGRFLSDVSKGQAEPRMPFREGFAAGVRVTTAPWPSEQYPGPEGIPVRGLRDGDWEHFYIYDIKRQEGDYVTSQGYGIVGIATGYGDSVDKAFDGPYRIVEKLKLPDKQYRTDLSEVCSKDIENLSGS